MGVFNSADWMRVANSVALFPNDKPYKTRTFRISERKCNRFAKKIMRSARSREVILGEMGLELGEEMTKKEREAFYRAVLAEARFRTGVWCQGSGYVTDYEKEAVRHFRCGADLGSVRAMVELGRCYMDGFGVPKSPKEAVKCYADAAERGSARAAFELGKIREHGMGGVLKDFGKAWFWYKKAAEMGYSDAQCYVGKVLEESRDVIHKREIGLDSFGNDGFRARIPQISLMLKKEFRHNYEEAFKWYARAAAQNNPEACYRLGMFYLNGVGVQQNDYEAYKCFQFASVSGDRDGAYMLGLCIESSRGCHYGKIRRRRMAERAYRTASAQGHLMANRRLTALKSAGRFIEFYDGGFYDEAGKKLI